jgi:hypothetical protein
LILCRVEVVFCTKPHTSARDTWNTGLDFVVGECCLNVHSSAFAGSVVDYGVPAGNKTVNFTAEHAQRIM